MGNVLRITILICLFSFKLAASQLEYWNLKPYNSEEIDGGKYHTYNATFLSSQALRLQLSIKGCGQEKLTAWVTLETPWDLSFGQQLTLYVNKLRPREGYIGFGGARLACKMEWNAPEMEAYDILETVHPALTDPFTISGQTYWAYMGKITRNDYSYGKEQCHDYGSDLDTVCKQNQSVDLEVAIESETPIPVLRYHWSANVIIFSQRPYDQVNVINNAFMNMCRKWEATDTIIILVHENYPGYYWIVNATKGGEAFFCRGTQATDLVSNVWNKM